ncbi:MAG: signal peptidase I [Acidobacteriaceae bacterium]|nr:signal peptidase I [Acidobacteriaceae bacterium]
MTEELPDHETSVQSAGGPIDTADPAPQAIAEAGLFPMLQSLARIVTIALFILTFIVQPFRIPSASMERTLLVGDFLLVNKQVYGPTSAWHGLLPYGKIRRGEIVVFHYPVDPSLYLVKRVIGLPGDSLRLIGGTVYVNGSPLHEPYAVFRQTRADNYRDNFPQMSEADPAVETRWWIQMRSLVKGGELTVPPGSYFVMGDNRNDSQDSRYWGFVQRAAIVGEPLLIYLSLREPDMEAPQHPGTPAVNTVPEPLPLLDKVRWMRTLQVVR